MKKIISFLFLFIAIVVSAHEFWLQPSKFIFLPGEKATVKFLAGENFEGQNWTGDHSKINLLLLYTNGKKSDLSSKITDKKGDSLQLTMNEEGSSIIVYNSNNSFIELAADKFNAYLEEDGLRETINYRREHQENDSIGRELYQRSVKTILQVGKKYDSSYKQPAPLPLDFIPLKHPYLVAGRGTLSFKVLFEQKPLADQLIKVWFREEGKTIKEEVLTDANGIVTFRVKRGGQWMISTVKMIRLQNDGRAPWQSYWGSCTWGYE